MTKTDSHQSGSDPRWWQVPGSLRNHLLRRDGHVGTVVNAEKHVSRPMVVSGELAGELGRIARQMGLGTDDGVAEQSGKVPGSGCVSPGFTREVGSFRRQVPPQGPGMQEE